MLRQILGKTYILADSAVMDGMVQEAQNAQMRYTWHFEPYVEVGGGDESALDDSGQAGQTNPMPGGDDATSTPVSNPFTDVPDYPNVVTAELTPVGMLVLTNHDSVQQVAQFYKTEIPNLGWMDTSIPLYASTDNVQLTFTDGQMLTAIMIFTNEGMTTIMITQVGQ